MDVSGGLRLVQTVLQVFGSTIWTEIESVLGVEFQLDRFKETMSTINNVLLDADDQERLHRVCCSNAERGRLERLKDALYQADDLFDEVITITHRNQLMPGNNLCNKVCLFFSHSNQLRSAFTWSHKIEKIRKMLDDIVKDHNHDFGLRQSVSLEASRVRDNSRETHSYLCEEEDVIIGRDDDKQMVINMLLDTAVEADVCFISIVGIGGLGKTTLAQLVYNDERVRSEFPLKMWVCVSDDFNVEALLRKILAAATNKVNNSRLSLDQLQKSLWQALDGKKYLLVLDDTWNEKCEEWRKLRILLIQGGKGSRIIITTRSRKVAEVREGRYLINKPHLLNIKICWSKSNVDSERRNNSEALLQGLQPHPNVRKFELWKYPGVRFPSAGGSLMNLGSCLPNLVTVNLEGCARLKHLPLMSQMRHLKVLKLGGLWEVEYLESSDISGDEAFTALRSRQAGADDEFVFFPSLKMLVLNDLPKLKGWWTSSSSYPDSESGHGKKETGNSHHIINNNDEHHQRKQFATQGMQSSYSFPKLCSLKIRNCPKLTTFPLCPKLETLELALFKEGMVPIMRTSSFELSSSRSTSKNRQKQDETARRGRLRKVVVDNVGYLQSLHIDSLHHLSLLVINDLKTKRLTTGRVAKVFRSGRLSSLRTLVFEHCSKLKKLSGGVWEHITTLETLHLSYLNVLEFDNEAED